MSKIRQWFWTWALRRVVLRSLGGAVTATAWVDDTQGQSGVTRVKFERDWKQP